MKNILFCLLSAVLVLSASCDQEIKPVEYKVSFDANGGNGTLPDSLTVVEGGVTALPSGEGLSRAGYEFAGWSEERDGDLLGESIVVSRDVVLHAKWNDSFSVSYREDYTGEVKSIEIPALYQGKVVDSIPSGGFSGCPMTSVVIPDSIHHIFSNAFHGCSSLTSLKRPSGVSVWSDAFSECSALETLTISDKVQFKSGREFSDCMLKKIIVEGKVSPLKDTFYHCPIEEIVFGNAELVWPDEVLAKALDEKLLKEPNKVKILVGV